MIEKRHELMALLKFHAEQFLDRMPYPNYGPNRILFLEETAQRMSDLCKELYPLEKKQWEESNLAKSATSQKSA